MTTESKNDVEKGKQVININGGIHADRDVVMRDQINYGTVADIQNPPQFAAALQNVQEQIAQIKQGQLTSVQVRNLEVVEGRISEATEEVKKPQPLLEQIKTSLTDAKDTMEMLGGGLVQQAVTSLRNASPPALEFPFQRFAKWKTATHP